MNDLYGRIMYRSDIDPYDPTKVRYARDGLTHNFREAQGSALRHLEFAARHPFLEHLYGVIVRLTNLGELDKLRVFLKGVSDEDLAIMNRVNGIGNRIKAWGLLDCPDQPRIEKKDLEGL